MFDRSSNQKRRIVLGEEQDGLEHDFISVVVRPDLRTQHKRAATEHFDIAGSGLRGPGLIGWDAKC
jgi:hypothetical protein